ncbi:DUF1178 family protein [Acidocella aromatica]|uniref:DUF1178 family protein n=1 Tax=Acidocella aromatica TaxID=1303579 RepID=A0A840VA68_9PROT|nr:DUF1178 family protein [Acidocella aromatica]MBB5372663.1 hypothetical protein [Acidocella aromatica]
MIHYQLRCAGGHEFDGWFKDSAGFESQAEAGMVACPCCGSTEVGRALMTPGIPRKSVRSEAEIMPPEPAGGMPAAGGVIPDAVRAALQNLRQEVEKHCDYVGKDFAEEARRIHNGETEARGIYGESSDEEAEALAEDGIAFARIPWVPRNDS